MEKTYTSKCRILHRDGRILKLYIFQPLRNRKPGAKTPGILWIHGGGYVYGSTKQYQFYCMGLAQRGFAVVSFNYHLAPKYKFPTPVYDTNLVMEWICRKAEIYGFDTDNVVIVGDSAGAQLASQYAVICTDPEYAKIMEITPPEFTLRAVGLNCGMYDLKKRAGEIPGSLWHYPSSLSFLAAVW